MRKLASLSMVACLLGLSAQAMAGKTVSAGTESLQIHMGLTPDKASAKGATLSINADLKSTTPDRRIEAWDKAFRIKLPAGLVIHPNAATVCNAALITGAKTPDQVCPASSVVGSGTATVDARPTIAQLVPATVTIYNVHGMYHDLAMVAHTSFANDATYFRILTVGHSEVLDAPYSPPAANTSPIATLSDVDVKIHGGSSHKPFISNPPTCHGSWQFSMTASWYPSSTPEPTITAHDAVPCKPAPKAH
jgi:hypothetical protein